MKAIEIKILRILGKWSLFIIAMLIISAAVVGILFYIIAPLMEIGVEHMPAMP